MDGKIATKVSFGEPAESNQNEEEPLMLADRRLLRKKTTIHDYLSTSGYYTCISKEPLPLRWNLDEDSPAGICFEAGNVVRMRSFVYKEPYLWAEVLSGGFVCAGLGDTRREAAGVLLEEYFEPYRLPRDPEDEEKEEKAEKQTQALRRLERHATQALDLSSLCKHEEEEAGSSSNSPRPGSGGRVRSPSPSSSEDDDGISERILELFRQFDVDCDGSIDLDELVRVLQSLDAKKWTHANCAQLLNKMDTDKDRQISYEEFVDWVCGTCRWRKERRAFFKQLGVHTGELEEMKKSVAEKGSAIRNSIAMWK